MTAISAAVNIQPQWVLGELLLVFAHFSENCYVTNTVPINSCSATFSQSLFLLLFTKNPTPAGSIHTRANYYTLHALVHDGKQKQIFVPFFVGELMV